MANIRGCNLPDDLYYLIEKHVWAKPMDAGIVRIGMTAVAAKLTGGKLTAITVSARKMGKEVPQSKSVATVESAKFVGPIPSPVTGVLLKGNEKLTDDPNMAISDPYGEGWIAEVQASDWETEKASLVTGEKAVSAYQAKMETDGISCD